MTDDQVAKTKAILEKLAAVEEGKKYDDGKLRYDLVPVKALEEVVKVLTKGAIKYGDWNWYAGLTYSRLYAAAQRHINAFWRGQSIDYDDVSRGLPPAHHLAHAVCCLMFMLEFELESCREHLDDRAIKDKLRPNFVVDKCQIFDVPPGAKDE